MVPGTSYRVINWLTWRGGGSSSCGSGGSCSSPDAALFEFVAAAEPRFAIAAQAPRWRATGPVAILDIVAKREACLGRWLRRVEGVNRALGRIRRFLLQSLPTSKASIYEHRGDASYVHNKEGDDELVRTTAGPVTQIKWARLNRTQDQKAQHSTSTHHILGRDLNDMLAAILFTLSSRSFFLLLSERTSCRISLTLWKFSSFAFP